MRKWLSLTLVALAWVAFVACGGDTSSGPDRGTGGTGGGGGLTCATLADPPPSCNDPCSGDSECGAGTFCLSGSCAAQCTSDDDCNVNASCSASGRCIPDMSAGGTGGSLSCPNVTITPSYTKIMFLVDQSGSMDEELSGGNPEPGEPTRWDIARDAITQVVSEVESIVRFGLTTYTSDDGFRYPETPPALCPKLPTQIDFALNNASTIDSSAYPVSYPSADGNDTPTGDSIDALVEILQNDPDFDDGPTTIVLATDGLPDSCECPDPGDAGCSMTPTPDDPEDEAVAAAGRSYAAGIDLFFLWVGPATTSVRNHVQEVANAGVGLATNGSEGNADYWVGDEPDELVEHFRTIVADSISCDIEMNEVFDDKDKACNDPDSNVRLGANRLECPSEWRVKPGVDNVIELLGQTCTDFKSGAATFSATFPCGAIVQ